MYAFSGQPAIVELFGHTVIAGLISEEEHFGTTLLRIDVPEINGQAAFTKFLGSGAIYGITPTDEGTMLRAAESLTARPVSIYISPGRQLPSPDPEYEEPDF